MEIETNERVHTAVRAFRVVVIPALAMLTLCCSITSWMACNAESPQQQREVRSYAREKNFGRFSPICMNNNSNSNNNNINIINIITHGAIALLHLVKLINAANASISQHQGASFKHQLLRTQV